MRLLLPLLLALLAFGAVAPAAGATLERTPGSVYLEFQRGVGLAKVRFQGNFFGHMGRGRIVATRNVIVSGADVAPKTLASGLILYRGQGLGFRTPGTQRWKLRLNGAAINATGFVRGCMVLNGADSGPTGLFRIGRYSQLRAWPRIARTFRLGLGC